MGEYLLLCDSYNTALKITMCRQGQLTPLLQVFFDSSECDPTIIVRNCSPEKQENNVIKDFQLFETRKNLLPKNVYSNLSPTSHKVCMIYNWKENSYSFLLVIWVNYKQFLYSRYDDIL